MADDCMDAGGRVAPGAATEEQLPRVISFPIPLRIMLASQPQWVTPVLSVIHRVISAFLIKQAGLKVKDAHTGAVTLMMCKDA